MANPTDTLWTLVDWRSLWDLTGEEACWACSSQCESNAAAASWESRWSSLLMDHTSCRRQSLGSPGAGKEELVNARVRTLLVCVQGLEKRSMRRPCCCYSRWAAHWAAGYAAGSHEFFSPSFLVLPQSQQQTKVINICAPFLNICNVVSWGICASFYLFPF